MEKIKVLLLGSTSFLSSYLIDEINKNYKNEIALFYYSRKKPTFNINSYKSIISFIKSNNIEFIINFIANTDVQDCENNFLNAFNSNVKSILKFKEIFLHQSDLLKGFIHISTDQLYENKLNYKSKEFQKPFLNNNYSLTKFLSETIIKSKRTVILRTNFFGFKKKYLDKNPGWILKEKNLKKEIYGYTNIFFNPVHSSTLAKIILIILYDFKPGIYNIGSSNVLSKYEFFKSVVKKCKINNVNVSKYLYKNTNLKRPFNMSMNIDKFQKIYKKKLPSLDDEISKLIKEYKSLKNEI